MEYFRDKEISNKIKELGILWKNSSENFTMFAKPEILNTWEKLIYDWKNDLYVPLVVRKSSDIRGMEIIHKSGRAIIITDNSLSQWIYYNVLMQKTYTLDEIKQMLCKDEIPFCFAIKEDEKDKVKYKKTLGKYSVNEKFNSKLCHIELVGLNTKEDISLIDIKILEDHFVKLANPKNMFLIDLGIGALGELQEFIDQQR